MSLKTDNAYYENKNFKPGDWVFYLEQFDEDEPETMRIGKVLSVREARKCYIKNNIRKSTKLVSKILDESEHKNPIFINFNEGGPGWMRQKDLFKLTDTAVLLYVEEECQKTKIPKKS